MARQRIQIRNRRTDSRISGEVRRLDDLRTADKALIRMEHHYRSKLAKTERRRVDAVALTEKMRNDALRADDRANVGLAAQRVDITATTLAERVDTTAKAATTATEASAVALRIKAEADGAIISNRLAPLEQARYENAGGKMQGQESKAEMHWTTERVIAVIAIAAAAFEFYLNQPH